MLRNTLWHWMGLLLCAIAAGLFRMYPAIPQVRGATELAFAPDRDGQYTFDTGTLRGRLRAEGKSQGLTSVVHVPSGTRLDRSLGLCGHYRVFTENKRYGTAAWDWPSTSQLRPDGAVTTVWPATDHRPFTMTATYRWKDPQTLDVTTTVTAKQDLSGFESFFASYFEQTFPSPCVYVSEHPDARGGPGFLSARHVFGQWQMFPRDETVLPLIRDGRWTREPHPVDWTLMPHLAAPLCLRRSAAGDVTVVLMAPPEDCFAIATPYAGEGHYSLYLSLFGRDVRAGQTAMARARLIVATGASDDDLVTLHRQYVSELERKR